VRDAKEINNITTSENSDQSGSEFAVDPESDEDFDPDSESDEEYEHRAHSRKSKYLRPISSARSRAVTIELGDYQT